MSPQTSPGAAGKAKRRFHAAIFTSTDPEARTSLLVSGTLADIQANTPKGGCWRQVPAGVHRAAAVPALGALPTPVIVAVDLAAPASVAAPTKDAP